MGISGDRLLLANFFRNYFSEVTRVRFFSAFVVSACLTGILLRRRKRFTVLRQLCYSLYGAFLLTVTLFGRSAGTAVNSPGTLFSTWKALFRPGNPAGIYEILYNILLFLPLGFIFADSGYEKKKAVLYTFSASLGIETVQLLTGLGVLEICDLVHNTLGGYSGTLLYPAVRNIWTRIRKWRDR